MLNKKEYDDADILLLLMESSTTHEHEHEHELELISYTMIEPVRSTSINSTDKLGFSERALSAAGAALLSAIIVNPLDVAKVSHFPLSIDLLRGLGF